MSYTTATASTAVPAAAGLMIANQVLLGVTILMLGAVALTFIRFRKFTRSRKA